jgi:hypothetical protein
VEAVAVQAKVAVVTPEMASKWLAEGTGNGWKNRNILPTRVARYAADMAAGRWMQNGESIVFGEDGRLQNGQHRLSAVVRAGVSVPMIIVRGVQDEAYDSMDSGRPRSAADVIRSKGSKNATVTASVIRLLYAYFNWPGDVLGAWSTRLAREFSNKVAVEYYEKNRRKIVESVEVGVGMPRHVCPPSPVAFSYYIFSGKNQKRADDFFSALAQGTGLRRGHPVHTLRERLAKESHSQKRSTVPAPLKAYLIFKAWNAYVRGEKLSKMELPPSPVLPKVA